MLPYGGITRLVPTLQGGQQRYFDGAQWTEQRTAAHKPPSKRWIWVLVGVMVLAFGGCSVLMSMTHQVAQENLGDGHTQGTGGRTVGVGQEARDGKFSFVVSDVGTPQNYYGPRAKGKWIIATMTVSNTGSEPQSFFVQNQKLIDTAGRQYAADIMAAMQLNPSDSTMVLDMNPGFSVTVKVPFDVPPGTAPAAVEVHDSAFSGGARVTVG